MPVAPRQMVLLAGPPVVAAAGLVVIRRHPSAAAVAGVVVSAGLDAMAGEPAPLLERILSVVAVGVLGTCWWLGTIEQTARYLRGERLLGARFPSVQATPGDLRGRNRG